MPFSLDVRLIHPEAAVCDAFRRRFEGLDVSVVQMRAEEVETHDCFVAAGNAFGIMTAGVDAAVVAVHGSGLMARVQRHILDAYLGEQPVGTCLLVPTGTPGAPYVAYAPTMRMPGPIVGTDAVYRATWAAFLAVYRHNVAARRTDQAGIRSVVFPAFGTGFGAVEASEAARQMAAACRAYLTPPHRLDWDAAVACHRRVAFDGTEKVVR